MQKLKLDLEMLEVESFVPGDAGERRGTVRGKSMYYSDTECATYRESCTDCLTYAQQECYEQHGTFSAPSNCASNCNSGCDSNCPGWVCVSYGGC